MYPSNSNCLWVIQVPEAKQVEVTFEDFDLEPELYCRKDRMVTYSAESDEPVIECGKTVLNKVVKGNRISIELLSDGSTEGRGFRARYKTYYEKDLTTKSPGKCRLVFVIYNVSSL